MDKSRFYQAFERLVALTRELLHSDEFKNRCRTSANVFVRRRKMDFTAICLCLLNLMRKPLALELDNWCEITGEGKTITKQAFSKARAHIRPEAFIELFEATAGEIMQIDDLRSANGYRFFAIDGTTLEVPSSLENIEFFGTLGGERTCRARASALCELTRGFVVAAEIDSIRVDERTLALRHIEKFRKYADSRDVLIFDRGYASKPFLRALADVKYLFRLQRSFSRKIDACNEPDFTVNIGTAKNSLFVRAIKFMLESGEIETLITNLPPEDFKTADFPALYAARWEIEGRYNTIKNKLEVEHFSGASKIAIFQDFYATMYAANMVSLVKAEADDEIACETPSKPRTLEYQANEKMIVGKMKNSLLRAVVCNNPILRLFLWHKLVSDAKRFRSEIRPGRHSPRPGDCHHKRKRAGKSVL